MNETLDPIPTAIEAVTRAATERGKDATLARFREHVGNAIRAAAARGESGTTYHMSRDEYDIHGHVRAELNQKGYMTDTMYLRLFITWGNL